MSVDKEAIVQRYWRKPGMPGQSLDALFQEWLKYPERLRLAFANNTDWEEDNGKQLKL